MLSGDKVSLGPLTRGDGPLLFAWLNLVGVGRINGSYRPTDEAKFDQWFTGIGNDPARVVFAIRRKGDARLLGYVQIVDINGAYRSGVLGILIGAERDRGQGIGREAIQLAIDFCWQDLNLQRLTLYVFGDNPRAVRTYLGVGFEVEGTMRRAAFTDGRFQDVTVMGLLRPEPVQPGA
jgi:RimJ/RimL family protein N-acetyltransferase